jgi:hypothetical protein
MLNWLMNHVFDRKGYAAMERELTTFEELSREVEALNAHPMVTSIDVKGIAARYPHLDLLR